MQHLESLYEPGCDKGLWSGRMDADSQEYFYQIVEYLDLEELDSLKHKLDGYAVLGFMSDEGVRRNLGRVGAKDGPDAFRQAFSKLPIHSNISLYDAGNVRCVGGDLEAAQVELGARVYQLLELGLQPLVVGGGHETAFGHYQGIHKYFQNDEVAILNFDAHFDLRDPKKPNWGSSGTPFRQIHNLLSEHKQKFSYYCAGIQSQANTKALFDFANQEGVQYIYAADINREPYTVDFIEKIINLHEHIYVSICLDVFNAAIAPGVSAPQPLGIEVSYVLEALRLLQKSQKVVSMDIVEMAPQFDIQGHTAKLAASLFFNYCMVK